MTLPAHHPTIAKGKIGFLLVNLGTPDRPDAKAVKAYLKEFLSDRRVIEISPLIWQPILRGIILNIRPRKSARAYAKIWDRQTNESPLRRITREQAANLSASLADAGVLVDWAMRYGTPNIHDKLLALQEAGCQHIAIMPLYPQYSATSSASVYDEVCRTLLRLRWQPTIRNTAPWYDDPAYITALAESVTAHLETLSWQPDIIIASFHGIPLAYFKKGDPYHCQCAKTARLLQEALGLSQVRFRLTFQSRFGFSQWLTPYTDATIKTLAQEGVKKIALITPGFMSDCLETLEEIDIATRESFLQAGGTHFTTVPCLNASEQGNILLTKLAKNTLAGWI